MSIQVTRASLPEFEEYVKEIEDMWDTKWLTNMGIKHNMLESQLNKYLKVPNVSLFANGHLALECILSALNLEGEVITTPFTFASTTHAIVRSGLTPVFCDIKPDDYTMDSDKIEDLITEKTCAILPVHVYGNVCEIEKIEQIAYKHNLKVVYDAAHAFGVEVNGKGIGEFGDASMFSFHATKIFNTIEGGAVTYKDDCMRKTLNDLKNFGITGPETVEYVGGNAKMNEFQAAMGICNLRSVDKNINKRKLIFDQYIKRLSGRKEIRLIRPKANIKSNYAYFPIVFDGIKYNRDEIQARLEKRDIFTRKYFYPLTSCFSCYEGDFDVKKTPVARLISENVLTLPLYPELSISDVDRICDIILGNIELY